MSDKMHTQERATYWERRWHNGPFHIVAMEVAKIENALKKSEKAFSNLQDDHLQLHQNCAALRQEIKRLQRDASENYITIQKLRERITALKLIEKAAIEVDRIAQIGPDPIEEYGEWLSVWHKALDDLHALLRAEPFTGGTTPTYFSTERPQGDWHE